MRNVLSNTLSQSLCLALCLCLIAGCTTARMWRQSNNLITSTLLTPVTLVEDVVTFGGTTSPAEGIKLWGQVLGTVTGLAIPSQMQGQRQYQAAWSPAPLDRRYDGRYDRRQGPRRDRHYYRQPSAWQANDFNRQLQQFPAAAGPDDFLLPYTGN